MPSLSSKKNERKILALLLKSPTHMRALNMDLELFAFPKHKLAATLIKDFVIKYKSPPSMSALKRFAVNYARNDVETAEELVAALMIVKKLPKVKVSDASFEFDQAENYCLGRLLFDVGDNLRQKFDDGETDYRVMRQKILTELLSVGSIDAEVRRGMIYDTAQARAEAYVRAEHGEMGDIIPFGIEPLDTVLGGMKKSFLTLLYSKTGGGKTRTAVNLAYNAAKAGYNVMYFTLEMAFDLVASCFDSREAWVDGNKIIFGKLNKTDKRKYAKALQRQIREKLNVWIVDIAKGAKSSLILEEIEMYKAIRGVRPDLVIIDYANIMEPMKRYPDRSSKYDFLFEEYHQIAKYANVALVTATQESREAAKADIAAKQNKKNEVEQGVHNIGLSHYMATHCENVIRLKQDNKDKIINRLWAIIDKGRYGGTGSEIPLYALWKYNYVGDKRLGGLTIRKHP